MKYTQRGFGIYTQFRDTYDHQVRVVRSSAAFKRRVWIFCTDPNDSTQDHSAHLSPIQARKVGNALLKFADGTA